MKKNQKEILGWCLFDVANSSYTTLIITVAFCIVFTKLIVGPAEDGTYAYANALWSTILAFSWAFVGVLGPALGNWSDRHGTRKKLLLVSVLLCCLCSAFLVLCRENDIVLACALVMGSNIGFAFSENFIAAFLPHIASREQSGKLSGLGWGLGYFGGLLSVVIAQQVTGFEYVNENWVRLKWIGPLVAVFFFLAALPSLFWLREPAVQVKNSTRSFFKQLIAEVGQRPLLGKVLLSCFFFQGGVAIVISFAALYADQEMHFTGAQQALLFVSLQLSAALGAFVFGWLQSHRNSLKVLNATLYIWLVAIFGIYLVRPVFGSDNADALTAFFVFANIAGLGLGATQSCGRVLVALSGSQQDSGIVFGLWGTSVKFSQVVSLLLFGLVQLLLPIRQAMLLCAVFFAVPLLIHRSIDSKAFSVS